MKQYWVLLLVPVLLLALLSGCEQLVPELTPTESNDSIADEYGFTIFPEGNYLADPMFDTDEFLPGYDANTSFIQYLSTGGFIENNLVLYATDDTVYFFDDDSHNILFFDKATGIGGPLCGRPECLHNDGNCNAYIAPIPASSPGETINGLRVYDGKLYWSGGRMDLDGTKRESGPWRWYISGINNNPTTVIHRGYVYTAGSKESVEDGVAISTVTVNATAMDSGESFTLLSQAVAGKGANCTVKPVGNDLYILVYYFNYIDDENPEAGDYTTVELYRWDSKTRQAEFLYKGAEAETGLSLEHTVFQPVAGDGIYLMGYRFPEVKWGGYYHTYVCKYSFATGELEELAELDCEDGLYYNIPYYTSDYILVRHSENVSDGTYEHTLSLYDYDGDSVFTKSIGEHPFSMLLGIDNEYIYIYCLKSYLTESGPTIVGYYLLVPLDGGDVIVLNEEQ